MDTSAEERSLDLYPFDPRSRSDYGSGNQHYECASIASIESGSPAEDAGLQPGMVITHVEGNLLRDMIDWNWYACEESVYLEGYDPEVDSYFEVELERQPGQSWGIEFTGVLFDGIRTCKNACKFCFMAMLPKDMRSSLYLRDDDYRLSFLQGNFVTFTNMTDEDVARVIEQRMSPLNMSLHASNHDIRRYLIGKHESRGLEVLDLLLDAGIEIHGQIVLCPHINDGAVLEETLEFVHQRPGITSLGIVPLGFTKHQTRFNESFAEPGAAQQVLDLVSRFQSRARSDQGITRYHLADEFYFWTEQEPPQAEFYDGYPQFYDGIGMYRSFIDDMSDLLEKKDSILYQTIEAWLSGPHNQSISVMKMVTGTAFEHAFRSLLQPVNELIFDAEDQLHIHSCDVQGIRNEYFGGNVDVTGLVCAEDILNQLNPNLSHTLLVIPSVIFNFDGLTLDGMSKEDLIDEINQRGAEVVISGTEPHDLFEDIHRHFCIRADNDRSYRSEN